MICLVSKSGSTTETVANFDALHGFLHEKFEKINHRVVVVTAQNSPHWIEADNNGYKTVDHQMLAVDIRCFQLLASAAP